jgi:hypothetical protein
MMQTNGRPKMYSVTILYRRYSPSDVGHNFGKADTKHGLFDTVAGQ